MDASVQAEGWEPTQLRQTPSWLIAQAATLTNRRVVAAYAEVGATRYQYAALSALRELGTATQAELGRYCHVDRSDTAGALAELEGEGYVKRRPNPLDRRQNLVSLTPRGVTRHEAIAAALIRAQDALLAGLSAAERREFTRLLRAVVDADEDGGVRA
ncbi:MarR family winged helix-turn-helix transcriptional regulator [Leucobacter chromiireducens]|uniref:MarR family transcriptional regulator n=1 Tax=Leucobacter chromiireducens subsp. solipictus TaxID=398235 RepID=A0ABS1SEM2_9MICO|nr:MarR family transcriptional regulator [Leucobacter chromiireducens]MBL3679000.1 MarR family transcriptional regulator [Leucobacter chromiireducens subsp. solipictus]